MQNEEEISLREKREGRFRGEGEDGEDGEEDSSGAEGGEMAGAGGGDVEAKGVRAQVIRSPTAAFWSAHAQHRCLLNGVSGFECAQAEEPQRRRGRKGVEGLIEVQNPNKRPQKFTKVGDLDADVPIELTRRERWVAA